MEFSGKTAFVTGAANGIGLGICRALARNGVNIVLADIERAQLEIARSELATFNVRTRAIEVEMVCSDPERHRERVEMRVADIPGHRVPTWQEVVDRDYQAWQGDRLVIDTAFLRVDQSVKLIRLRAGA